MKKSSETTDRWQKEHVERLTIKPRKELKLPERIQAAVDHGLAASRQDYIIKAVLEALEHDERIYQDGKSE